MRDPKQPPTKEELRQWAREQDQKAKQSRQDAEISDKLAQEYRTLANDL